jgi:AcrR family transcriptional regulator
MSTVDADTDSPARRLSSDERRAQILAAAMAVFGAKGYVGTTTDEVARAASVSQPYVVRLFGSKENLFLAALSAALDELLRTFRDALRREPGERTQTLIGDAYIDLLRVRGLHQTLSHAYLLGAHPVIGPAARRGFARVWQFFREDAGMDAEEAQEFLAQGMLINTMIGMRLIDEYGSDPSITELFRTCFPAKLPEVLEVVPRGDDPW